LKDLSSRRIAEGRTAVIYSWDGGHILKLFRDWCPSDWVEYEARIARAVYAAGVPSPAAGEIIEFNGRRGLIYERLDGISMLQDMNIRPWMSLKYARQLAEIQVQINKQSITGLPSYKDQLSHAIRNTTHLNDDLRGKVLTILSALPNGQNLCHGDYHPGNILITQRGPVVIDWMTACTGDPAADVARTHLLLTIGPKAAGNLVSPLLKLAIGLYYRAYRNHYNSLAPGTGKEAGRWLPVIAAARLNEDIAPEREALLSMVKERVSEHP
jgi:tRNA A-37 threonylcarbamoyl transferase component Bud32